MAALFTIVGSFFGPWGALIGSFIGQLLFPPKPIQGPRLRELNVQQSTVGAPIPIVYGTFSLAGNIIWSGGLIETKHTDEQGGKFGIGGQKVVSYTYSVDLAVGICEGPILGIRRIWSDADLIYDVRDEATLVNDATFQRMVDEMGIFPALAALQAMSTQLDFTLYLGTEDQLPDPTIESYEGVGNVPGYRGLAYIVFNGFQLEKFGNRIPSFRFEVFTAGGDVECGMFSAGQIYPWLCAENDPRDSRNNYEYAGPSTGYGTWHDTLAEALADGLEDSLPTPIYGWQISTSPNSLEPCEGDCPELVRNMLSVNLYATNLRACDIPNMGTIAESAYQAFGVGSMYHWNGTYSDNTTTGVQPGLYILLDEDTPSPPGFSSNFPTTSDPTITLRRKNDGQVAVRRRQAPPDEWNVTWTQVSGTFKALAKYDQTGSFGVVTSFPVNPTLRSDDANYSNQAYWESAYAAALAAGEPGIEPGWTYGVEYPETFSTAWQAACTAVQVECVPMADIVADICRRAGLRTDTASQIDVSDLSTCVIGYAIGTQMSARDALGPLRTFGLWDAAESGAVLKFVERAHAIGATLTTDDLGAHENGSQPPSAVEVSRVQEKDLARRVRVHFANLNKDHEPYEEDASRITTEAVSEIDVELAIVMEPDTAAQLAEILLTEQWASRNTYKLVLDHNWLKLEPTDCIEIPVDGETERVRITAINYKIGGLVEIDAVRDDDGSYTSTAVSAPSQPSGGLPLPGSGPICPSEAVLLDIPCETPTTLPVISVAIYSAPDCPSWACAELYRSNDGGVTFARVAGTDLEATVGEITDISGPATDPTLPGDSPPYDTANTITVELFEGTLGSITDAQIEAGQNLAAIGVDGRWVLIQFKTATFQTDTTWVLSDLVWGVSDTQHLLGTTGVGDTFVLLNSAVLKISDSVAAIGVEKQYKVVTCGQAVEDADAFTFTLQGLCYVRTCPSTVLSASLTDPPASPADGDAYLLPNDTSLSGVWANHGGEVAHWSDETDSWVFCTPLPGTIIHIVDQEDSSGGGGDVISGGDGSYTPGPWAPTTATYVTVEDETAQLPNSRRLTVAPGSGLTLTQTTDDALELGTDSSAGGGGDISGPVSSTDNAIVRWDGTTGTLIQDSDSILSDADELTTPNASAAELGYKGIPQVSISSDTTLDLTHAGKCIYKGSGATVTITIPANSSVAFPIGTAIEGINDDTETLTVAITTDTLVMYRTGATGSRSVSPRGYWQIRKVTSTRWYIGGDGVT